MSRIVSGLTITTRVLFFVGSAAWMVVAALVALGVVSTGGVPAPVSAGLAAAMIVGGAAMAFLGLRCLKGTPLIDAIAVVAAVGNIVLTLTDQVGVFDYIYLAFAAALLCALVAALVAYAST